MAETAAAEKKGNLTEYVNCNCRLEGGMAGGKAPTVVYEAPKNVRPGKLVSDAESVKAIQQFLNKENANDPKPRDAIKEDSRWGTGTSTAFYRRMIEIQESNGIKPNGQYNSETADIMRKNGMGKEADALDKMKKEGTLDRVYNHKLAKVICDGAAGDKPATDATPAPKTNAPGEVSNNDSVRDAVGRALADEREGKRQALERANFANTDAQTPNQGIRNEKVDRDFIDSLQGKVDGRAQADLYKPNIPGLKEAADIVSGRDIKTSFNLTAEHNKAVANPGPLALDRKPDVAPGMFVADPAFKLQNTGP